MRRVYTSLEYNAVETLPVAFELADQDFIKQQHDEERTRLKDVGEKDENMQISLGCFYGDSRVSLWCFQMQVRLKNRVKEMEERERAFLNRREQLFDKVATAISTRNQSATNQRTYLEGLLEQIQKRTVQTM